MKIKTIEIYNFRGIKTLEKIDFIEYLNVLDGENGFGKTTVFDAIEFCITGTIKRLEFGKQDKPKTILKNKEFLNKESYVKIIFDDDTYIKRVINEDDNGDDLGKEYKLEGDKSKIEEIKEKFGNIFYVPQENAVELLKTGRSGVKDLENKLFDVKNEDNFISENLHKKNNNIIGKIDILKNRLNNKKGEIENKINNYNKELEFIKTNEIKSIDFVEIDNFKNYTNYTWYNLSTFSKEQLEEIYIKSWKDLLNLFQNRKKLNQFYVNKKVKELENKLDNKKDIIVNNLNYYLFFESQKLSNLDLSKLQNQIKELEDYLSKLELLKNDNKKLDNIDSLFGNLKENSLFYEDLKQIEEKFLKTKEEFKKISSENKKYNNIFGKLIHFWEEKYLKQEDKDLVVTRKGNKLKEDICPLCTTKKTKNLIVEQIKFLKEKLGILEKNSSNINLYSLIFDKNLYDTIKDKIKEIKKEEEKLREIIDNKNDLNYFKKLLEKYKINIDNIQKLSFKEDININLVTKNIEFFNLLKEKVGNNYKETESFNEEDYEKYKNIYKILFNEEYPNNKEILLNLDESIIRNNISFFENEKIKLLNNQKNKLKKEIKILKKEIEFLMKRIIFLKDIEEKLKIYKDKINYNIKKYKSEKRSSIGLPLYVFVKRIIKNYNGVEIILTEKSLKDGETDANPMFTFSSGQAEGLALSLMLANNLNYKSIFKTILIDDPIQSLDDLNILSFINLLRYQFSDKQIIISTHDNSFSRFIRYKFWRLYGENSHKRINMKERFFEK